MELSLRFVLTVLNLQSMHNLPEQTGLNFVIISLKEEQLQGMDQLSQQEIISILNFM